MYDNYIDDKREMRDFSKQKGLKSPLKRGK